MTTTSICSGRMPKTSALHDFKALFIIVPNRCNAFPMRHSDAHACSVLHLPVPQRRLSNGPPDASVSTAALLRAFRHASIDAPVVFAIPAAVRAPPSWPQP